MCVTSVSPNHHPISHKRHTLTLSSSMSSPNTGAPKANLGAPKGYYDPDFTVDISKKMQVPEKIKLAPNSITNGVDGMLQDPAIVGFKKVNDNTEWMRVPDRICVVGEASYLISEMKF